MDDAGQKLKQVRERLDLRYRDVEDAANAIAERHGSDEFSIALSRLSDIENKGTVPSIYRLYTLCAIYRLDLLDVLEWYGVKVSDLPADSGRAKIPGTHPVSFDTYSRGHIPLPLSLDPGVDLRKTTYLSRMIQRWGKLPVLLLNRLDVKNHRYAYIGTEDWTMYPILQPGCLVMIDEARRKIVNSGWTHEMERPIYFMEHRGGYTCAWCHLTETQLMLQPHPASLCEPQVFDFPTEIEVIGQVVGIAMRLDPSRRRRTRS